LAGVAAGGTPAIDFISHGHFDRVGIYKPPHDPRQFVLLLSGNSGMTPGLIDAAQVLAAQGAIVATIDTGKLIAGFKKDKASCFFPDGDLENLSHYIQAYYKLEGYLVPILVGYSSGATIAHAMITRAAPDIFTGAVLVDANREPAMALPLCKQDPRGVPADGSPANPRLQYVKALEFGRVMPQLVAAYAQEALLRPRPVRAPATLSDLPIIEVGARGNNDVFAVFLSGDGGWAGIDKEVAGALASRGIPVAGLDSLRYFWSTRTPAGLAADVDRMLQYYSAHWNKQRAVLIGYSQGADTLPFAVNRLTSQTKRMVAITVLLALSGRADFEFHLSNWISTSNTGLPVLPEMRKLSAQPPTLCVYGADDDDALCPAVRRPGVEVAELEGGHHFDGDYAALARRILDFANAAGAR